MAYSKDFWLSVVTHVNPGMTWNEVVDIGRIRRQTLSNWLKKAVTKEIFTLTNETYLNAESVCLLLSKIAARYAGEMITSVLDNARYQKCAFVRQHAAALRIELLFLPAYSPQLNLIERLWRYVRKECLYSKYYSKFDGFKQSLLDCIQNAHPKHQDELETLLSLNFQSFHQVKISTV